MSTTIAIVLNVSGTAWAEAPDGSRRLLEEGSALMAGERLVTEDDARVQLDFGYDNLTVIEGGTTILATAEMAGDFIPVSANTSLEDDSVAQALASIEAALGGSIEDAEAPAAGLEGGSSGGSSTVRLARIVENIDPAEFSLETSSVANRQFIDEFGEVGDDGDVNAIPDNTVVLPGDISIDSVSGGSVASPTLMVSGSSSNLLPSSSVQVTITDQDGNTVSQQIMTGPNGEFTSAFPQTSGLVDGPLTVVATGTGLDGETVSDTGQGNLDLITGALDVSIDNVDDGVQTIDLSGTTNDVAPGESVAITITDADNNVVNTTAIVANDGSYSVTGTDISSLVDGDLTVDASATDRNGNPVSDTATDALDALAGDLTVAIDAVNDGAQTIDLSGTTTDVSPGESVSITITDADNNVVTTTAIVGGDGSYTVTGTDISGLVDGALTVDASATDRNGDPVSDAAIDNFDATQGNLTVAIDALDDTAQTMNLSGTTTDVKSGDPITITITDTKGTVLTVNTTAGSNGAYEVDGIDVSTLVDGTLTVKADAIDRNGVGVSDTTTGTLDANASPDAGDDSYGINAIQGFFGEYFAYQQGPDGGNLGTLARADAFLAANHADATFTATSINYRIPNGNLGSEGKLQSFLGADAGSLSNDPENSSDAIIRMTGEIVIDPGTYQFRVTADDGYRILVNGVNVAEVNRNQAPATNTNGEFTLDNNGPHSIEVVYWDQGGQAQLKIEIRPQGGVYRILGSQDISSNGIDSALVTDENQALTINPSTLLGNDSDADGDSLSIQSVQGAVNGEVSLDTSGNILFTPDAYYVGEATFDYTVSDGRGGEDTATVTLNVRAAADSLSGTDQADTLNGTGNDDVIRGLAGDDTLDGGAGNDVLIGGSGADLLTGGIGADVFRWALGDESSTGTTNDVVTDFTIDSQNGYTAGVGQGNQLELSDLLQDMSASTDISGYLMAQEDSAEYSTVLYLNKDGALNDDSANAQQSITLSGVTMDGQTSDQFIDSMLNSGHIKIE
jgi:hypothetical protein